MCKFLPILVKVGVKINMQQSRCSASNFSYLSKLIYCRVSRRFHLPAQFSYNNAVTIIIISRTCSSNHARYMVLFVAWTYIQAPLFITKDWKRIREILQALMIEQPKHSRYKVDFNWNFLSFNSENSNSVWMLRNE